MRDDNTVALAALTPSRYSLRNVPRKDDQIGGGTGIFVQDSLNITLIKANQQQQSFESSEWNITACRRSNKFVIIYCPPYSAAHPVSYICVFLEEFIMYLENLVLCPEVLVIEGDFNLLYTWVML